MKRYFSVLLSFLLLSNYMGVSANEYRFCVGNCTNISSTFANLSSNSTVYLDPGVYAIHYSIPVKSDMCIIGNNSTLYTDSFDDIQYSSQPAMIYCNKVSNVTIKNVTFLGAAKNITHQHDNSGTSRIGGLREARNGIKVSQSANVSVIGCNFSLLLSDGLRVSRSSNVRVSSCRFDSAGHDSISYYRSNNLSVSNSYFNLFINTCIRFYHTDFAFIDKCTFIQNLSGTGAGYLEFQGFGENITICNSTFLKSADPVIFKVDYKGSDPYVYNNTFNGSRSVPSHFPNSLYVPSHFPDGYNR